MLSASPLVQIRPQSSFEISSRGTTFVLASVPLVSYIDLVFRLRGLPTAFFHFSVNVSKYFFLTAASSVVVRKGSTLVVGITVVMYSWSRNA